MLDMADKAIFIRNIFPIYFHMEDIKLKEVDRLINKIAKSKILNKKKTFVIETLTYKANIHSRDLEVKIGSGLEDKGYKVDFKNPKQIIFIVLNEDNLYSGILDSKLALYRYLSPEKRFSRRKDRLNRAQYKLMEALERFDLKLEGKIALDIGAAPGGWSKLLVDYGYKVFAVDPAKLDESLEKNPNIVHIKKKIEDVSFEKEKFDIILNDMNRSPKESAIIINDLSGYLKENGYVLMTAKLTSRNVDRHLNDLKNTLAKNLKIKKIKHLQQNRQEVTVLLKKEGE